MLCPDGIVINLKGPYPGRLHDAGILRKAGLYEELEQFTIFDDQNYVIYGDKGYSLRELLLRPYTEQEVVRNPQRQEFNNIMSSLRVAVEWGFQKVVQEFAFVDFKKKPEDIVTGCWIYVCNIYDFSKLPYMFIWKSNSHLF